MLITLIINYLLIMYLFIYLFICLFIHLFICLFIYLFIVLSFFPSNVEEVPVKDESFTRSKTEPQDTMAEKTGEVVTADQTEEPISTSSDCSVLQVWNRMNGWMDG